jgi:hypothetical protein
MTEYRWVSLPESIANNGERHLRRGHWYALTGNLAYAVGSYRKATRNFKEAAAMEFWIGHNALLNHLMAKPA